MKKTNNQMYIDISSFEDFRYEKESLLFRKKLVETKLSLNYLQIRNAFSVSTLLSLVAKEVVLPKISDLLGTLIKWLEKEADE
jgi:hypothetical protein